MPVQTKIQLRRDVASNWTTQVLASGEIGVETDTNRFKIGNGATAWGSLAYAKAGTATTLETARNINGVSFNGSADITVTAAAGTLTGTTLNATVVSSSLTSVGTITSGTWSGSFGAVSGANLTNLTAANLTGTISSTVLGNSTLYIGSTAVLLNRPTGNLALTGISSVTFPGSTSGTAILQATAVAGTGTTISLPAISGTLVLTANPVFTGSVTTPLTTAGVVLTSSGGLLSSSATLADSYLATISTAGKVSNSATTAASTNTASAIVARDVSGNFAAGTITASLTGNASTATKLQTARNINGVAFDGTADITVTTAAPSTLTIGTGLSGTSYNGGAPVTIAIDGTVATLTGAQALSNKTITLSAGTASVAPFKLTSGVNLTTAAAGSVEFDGTNLYFTPSTTRKTVAFIDGNVATATKLQTARNINGVAFDGTADITVTAAAGTLTGTALNSTVVTSSLTTVGTVTTGTWSGLFGSVSGANLTSLTAANLTGTISSTVLGNSTLYIGSTAVALNRATGNLALTGISSITLPGGTSGTVQLLPSGISGATVLTLPATTGTLVTTGDTGTVTNTMLAGSIAATKVTNTAAVLTTNTFSGAQTFNSNIVVKDLTGGTSGLATTQWFKSASSTPSVTIDVSNNFAEGIILGDTASTYSSWTVSGMTLYPQNVSSTPFTINRLPTGTQTGDLIAISGISGVTRVLASGILQSPGLNLLGSTSGTVALTAPAVAGSTAIAFPATSGTVALVSNIPTASVTTPLMDGTAAIGTGTTWAKADHVHPSDTTRAALSGATFTGKVIGVASSSSTASFNINGASDPTTPVTGDLWASLGSLKYYTGTATRVLAFTDAPTFTGTTTIATSNTTAPFTIQPTPTALSATATLTIAQLLTYIITVAVSTAVTWTLPTGTLTDAGIQGGALPTNGSFEWCVINTGSTAGAATIAAGTGHTFVGAATVGINTSARFRTVKTAANTFVTYRIS